MRTSSVQRFGAAFKFPAAQNSAASARSIARAGARGLAAKRARSRPAAVASSSPLRSAGLHGLVSPAHVTDPDARVSQPKVWLRKRMARPPVDAVPATG